ncbi:MAG: hypothetical protein H0U05_00910 [Actinobacteria bacterium]|nr:hypothetical protein [Actinomycetota bacterium]
MRIRRIAAFGLLALAALALAALAVAVIADSGSGTPESTTAAPVHPVAGNFKPDGTRPEDCSEPACLEQAYGNIAYYSGPQRALTTLEEEVGTATNECHRIAHNIGSASLARFKGNVGRTFAEGSSTCASGYYHGVLSRALVNVKSYRASALGAVARGLCAGDEVTALAELEYQCLHGLGHGLMITTGFNLPTSLEVCDRLRGKWKATSCNGGVFMENFFTSYGGQSPWVRADDPVYPCNQVAQEDKQTCYQLVTSRILRVIGLDWEKTAEICASVEKNWVASCFESYGRDVAGQTKRDPEKIRELCRVAKPYGGERECIRFAALDMVANDKTGRQAAALCDGTSGRLRAACYRAIGSIMARSRTTPEASEADCRSLTRFPDDVAACVRGAAERLAAPLGR